MLSRLAAKSKRQGGATSVREWSHPFSSSALSTSVSTSMIFSTIETIRHISRTLCHRLSQHSSVQYKGTACVSRRPLDASEQAEGPGWSLTSDARLGGCHA